MSCAMIYTHVLIRGLHSPVDLAQGAFLRPRYATATTRDTQTTRRPIKRGGQRGELDKS